jgi:hypothetical protein
MEAMMRGALTEVRYVLLLTTAFLSIEGSGSTVLAGFSPDICEEYCDTSTACEDECYIDMMEFENGNAITCLEYGVYDTSAACCGDGLCVEGEEPCNCDDDCGVCAELFPECNPITQTGCSSGQKCNTLGYCKDVPNCSEGYCDNGTKPTPPECFDNLCDEHSDCCPENVCQVPRPSDPGWCVPRTHNPF